MCTPQVKIWFQNRRMKWRNSKERELLASGGSREQTLPNKNNPNPDLSDADADRSKMDLSDVALDDEEDEGVTGASAAASQQKQSQQFQKHSNEFGATHNWPPDDEEDVEINVT